MRKIIICKLAIFMAITTASLTANAQYAGEKTVRALLGFKGGAIHLGADYEVRQGGVLGMGGYFFLQTDDDGPNPVHEVLALGAFAPVHLLTDSRVDAYVAPGFGFAMIDHPSPAGDDETTFGPSFKVGVDFRASGNMKVGVQHFILTNWLSDETMDQVSFTSASFTFAF